jgi:hypothetical protein
MRFVRAAQEITPTLSSLPFPKTEHEMMGLFGDGWQLDYQAPVVKTILDSCRSFLAQEI